LNFECRCHLTPKVLFCNRQVDAAGKNFLAANTQAVAAAPTSASEVRGFYGFGDAVFRSRRRGSTARVFPVSSFPPNLAASRKITRAADRKDGGHASVLSQVIIYDTTVIPRADNFCRSEESALASPKNRFLAEFTPGRARFLAEFTPSRARFLALLGMTRCSGLGMTESGRKCKELNGTVR